MAQAPRSQAWVAVIALVSFLPCACAARGGKPQQRGEGEAAVRVEARVDLRALVLAISADAAAVALRMLERGQLLQQYACHWSVRPKARALLACCAWLCWAPRRAGTPKAGQLG